METGDARYWHGAPAAADPVTLAFGTDAGTSEIFVLSGLRQNLTDATLRQVRQGVVRAWRAMLSLQIGNAAELIARAEPALGDLQPDTARQIRIELDLLRAVAHAVRDDSLASLALASSALKQSAAASTTQVASTLCRLGLWKLGDLDSFYALPRNAPGTSIGRRQALSAVLDLSIEAAIEFEQLRFCAAKRLALDALDLAETFVARDSAMAAFPASLVARIFYEQGDIDEADRMIRDRLPTIRSAGTIDAALQAYPVLTRIAVHRGQPDIALSLLGEAETLAEVRGWVRLAAVSLVERVNLLADCGHFAEADACVIRLDRLHETQHAAAEHIGSTVQRCRILARARVASGNRPSRHAVAILRQLHHEAVRKRDLYLALDVALRLAELIETVDDGDEAVTLCLQAMKLGWTVGLQQMFIDRGPGIGRLLNRLYERLQTSDGRLRELLPYAGSLVAQWRIRHSSRTRPKPAARSSAVLSARECNIVLLISRGLSNKEIALALKIAPETVKSHAKHIFIKLSVKTRAEAVSRAGALGLI